MVRTQIQLTKEQYEALKEIAKDRRCSLAEIVREGVDTVIRNRLRPPRKELIKRALALAGRYPSGKHDISRRHDDYLADDYLPGEESTP